MAADLLQQDQVSLSYLNVSQLGTAPNPLLVLIEESTWLMVWDPIHAFWPKHVSLQRCFVHTKPITKVFCEELLPPLSLGLLNVMTSFHLRN